MQFAHPNMLFWWAAIPLLAVVMAVAMLRQRALLARFGQWATVRRLAASASLERRVIKAVLVLAALSLVILALARPQWGKQAEPVTRTGVDVIIALDVSASMLTEDVAPDRLTRMRAIAADLMQRLEGNRIGLVAFAGSAFVQCPLTLDLAAAQLFLDILEVGDVPDAGSDLAEAVDAALDTLPPATGGEQVLILLSDGEDHGGRGVEAAGRAAAAGVLVYTLGLGTEAGGPIPLRTADGRAAGYKKDGDGNVVTSRLVVENLVAMAEAGGGQYIAAGASFDASRRLAEGIDRMTKADLSSRIITTHKDRYQFPLAMAFLLLVIEGFIAAGRRLRRMQA